MENKKIFSDLEKDLDAMVKCGRCKSSNVISDRSQLSSADEGMTNFCCYVVHVVIAGR